MYNHTDHYTEIIYGSCTVYVYQVLGNLFVSSESRQLTAKTLEMSYDQFDSKFVFAIQGLLVQSFPVFTV